MKLLLLGGGIYKNENDLIEKTADKKGKFVS
ncbi:hypothetical protein CNEO4_960006 [Clostridium neonatale]|uniref:Uncharacterized protein n=1 Tax=Clostridium neonatale TaxID=137838 RepID=A0AA86JVC9_9CLOT|nr:hypothetical protein CNEO_260071 [Clostridium neonatale]CAG9710280.1 hypothetical protein CNEO_44684 [Clostridium neonatale]CAG9718240.1 hypothetical protein CNEO_660071 [Clostridium neonatale]CAI3207535.1 hypothetical protein CNEO2_50061 [Clostridium neonatale]CAI3211442.1 hypothetical protein CNEO2_60044 [Clostridium neonatale]